MTEMQHNDVTFSLVIVIVMISTFAVYFNPSLGMPVVQFNRENNTATRVSPITYSAVAVTAVRVIQRMLLQSITASVIASHVLEADMWYSPAVVAMLMLIVRFTLAAEQFFDAGDYYWARSWNTIALTLAFGASCAVGLRGNFSALSLLTMITTTCWIAINSYFSTYSQLLASGRPQDATTHAHTE